MRRKKADLRCRVNDNLEVEFTAEGLTSYAGLELLMRYLRNTKWNRQLHRYLGGVVCGGDFGVVGLCRVILSLMVVGGRRLRHLDFLRGDLLVQRFCGLRDLPTDDCVSRFLKRFTCVGQEALKALNADVVAHKNKAFYAIKVPFWKGRDMQRKIRECTQWQRVEKGVEKGVDGFTSTPTVKKWKRTFNIVIFRKRVMHPTRKNYQLDLFDPDDGTFEYSAVATNLSLKVRGLWRFMAGRGMHEKAIGELKTGLGFNAIPTNDYNANSAWQQFVILAHNLLTNFRIETGLTKRNRTWKNTNRWPLKSIRTLRFELISRAGYLLRPQGRLTLRLQPNIHTEKQYRKIATFLRNAA